MKLAWRNDFNKRKLKAQYHKKEKQRHNIVEINEIFKFLQPLLGQEKKRIVSKSYGYSGRNKHKQVDKSGSSKYNNSKNWFWRGFGHVTMKFFRNTHQKA